MRTFQKHLPSLDQTDKHIQKTKTSFPPRGQGVLLIPHQMRCFGGNGETEKGRIWDVLTLGSIEWMQFQISRTWCQPQLNRVPLYRLWVLGEYELLTLSFREWPRLTQTSPMPVSCNFPQGLSRQCLPPAPHRAVPGDFFQYQSPIRLASRKHAGHVTWALRTSCGSCLLSCCKQPSEVVSFPVEIV